MVRASWIFVRVDLGKALDLVAHARFASVCSSWRSVAVENPPINKPLYMALSHEPANLVRRFITSFIPNWDEAKFIGALDGWLVITIGDQYLFLLNKGLNSIIPLPPPPIPMVFTQRPYSYKAVFSSPPSSSSSNSGECTVFLKHGYIGLYYCRLGLDKSFKRLSNRVVIEDILFYKGRLYALLYANIIIFDHLLNEVSNLATDSTIFPTLKQLLISGNKILFVARRPSEGSAYTLDGDETKLVPLPWNNIGDNLLLLVNRYCCLSFTSTEEHKEFRRTDYSEDDFRTYVLDTSEDPDKAKVDDPWPLFFVMFNSSGIKRLGGGVSKEQ